MGTHELSIRLGNRTSSIDDALGMLSIILALAFPPAGLFVGYFVRREARLEGRDNEFARIGFNVSVFCLILYTSLAVAGFVLSVVLPLLHA